MLFMVAPEAISCYLLMVTVEFNLYFPRYYHVTASFAKKFSFLLYFRHQAIGKQCQLPILIAFHHI